MDAPTLVLHSSPARLALSWSAPLVLVGIGTSSIAGRGVAPVPLALVVAGVVLLAIVLVDLPLRTEFDHQGFTRVCPLRRQRIPWDRVVAVERIASSSRQRRALKRSTRGQPGARAAARSQGLTARLGPRRVTMLVDRRESYAEHDELRRLLRDHATVVRASAPPLDAQPAGRGEHALHNRRGSED